MLVSLFLIEDIILILNSRFHQMEFLSVEKGKHPFVSFFVCDFADTLLAGYNLR